MSINLYLDEAKTLAIGRSNRTLGDGINQRFYGLENIADVYLDGVRLSKYQTIAKLISFDQAPLAGQLITCTPANTLNFDSGSELTIIQQVWVEATEDCYLISRNEKENTTGSLFFSLDNIDFFTCINVPLITTTIWVKHVFSSIAEGSFTHTDVDIVAFSSELEIDSSGIILTDFPEDSLGVLEYVKPA